MARSLARAIGAPHVELDSLYHQPGWTPLDGDSFRGRVLELTGVDAYCEIEPLAVGSNRAWRCAQVREQSGADR